MLCTSARHRHASWLLNSKQKWKHISSVIQNVRTLKIILYHTFYRPLYLKICGSPNLPYDTHGLLWTRDSSARKDPVKHNFLQSLKWNVRFPSLISKWLGYKGKLSSLALAMEVGRLWHSLIQAVNVRVIWLNVLNVLDQLGRCQYYFDLAGIQCTQHLCIYTSTKLIYCMPATFDRYT